MPNPAARIAPTGENRFDLTQTPAPPLRTAAVAVNPIGRSAPDPTAVPTAVRGGATDEVRFPVPGDDFAGFQLVEELGRGGFGRVFLAEEWRLAGRKVVLKITPNQTNEPQRLARLQHTNIVPIQNAFRANELSALQMPYFGRQTLADLLAFVREENDFPRVPGRVFSSTAARQSTSRRPDSGRPSDPIPTPLPFVAPAPAADDPHPIREMLARLAYTDAVVWLGERLADGLAHAHARGILHLDLKPHNVLFSDDGQPMLLDFNLGYDTTRQDRERIGGTWPYMAPEQIEEYMDRPGAAVDARTDLFSLGVLLYELLTCRHPFPAVNHGPSGLAAAVEARRAAPPPVREFNPDVPPSVEAVIAKLLAFAPADRYQSAEDLRTDLEAHREDRPMRFAPNPSVLERAAKWRRRNPRFVLNLALAAAVLAAGGLGAAFWQADAARTQAKAAGAARDLAAAVATLRVDLTTPDDRPVRQAALKAGADLLARYGVPADRGWADVPLVRDLPADDRAAAAESLGELAALMAHADSLEAKAAEDHKPGLDRAVGWNKTAAAWFSTTGAVPAVVWDQRADLAAAAGDADLAATVPADRPARGDTRTDLHLRAATLVAAGKYTAAIAPLAELAGREHDHYAANFRLAYCYQQTSQLQRALERYKVAQALAPNDPRPGYNCGLILLRLQRPKEAEAELTGSIARNDRCAAAYWDRGVARRRLGDFRGAVADLTRGLELGYPELAARSLRAELYERLSDKSAAAADRAAIAKLEPRHERDYITRGLLRLMDKDYTAALTDFDQATRVNPTSLSAWQNKAAVLGDHLNRTAEALDAISKAVELFPESAPARTAKAVLLARLGRRADAHREVATALQSATDPNSVYQAADVYALTARTHPGDRATAISYLKQALRNGFRDFAILDADPDLKEIRDLAEFGLAVKAARDLAR